MPAMNDSDPITDILQFCRENKISLAEFGSRLSPPVDKSTVSRWASRKIPAERVLEVSGLTNIPCHLLRSDIYPKPTVEQSKSTPAVAAAGEGEATHG